MEVKAESYVDSVASPARVGGHKSVHFVVAKGYDWDMNGTASYSTVTLNDPNNNNDYYGERTCKWTEMSQALNASNGWYIMAK